MNRKTHHGTDGVKNYTRFRNLNWCWINERGASRQLGVWVGIEAKVAARRLDSQQRYSAHHQVPFRVRHSPALASPITRVMVIASCSLPSATQDCPRTHPSFKPTRNQPKPAQTRAISRSCTPRHSPAALLYPEHSLPLLTLWRRTCGSLCGPSGAVVHFFHVLRKSEFYKIV
ncbi:hypothetical protein E2C01_057063 [Portunus trituberculatus]|uniref:Uncharacterized protein n=1 Tax=Portunus trituberculatus TaxID=210409 RepID=A0A5B7GS10_PORTR|nr:hypothetical protein [Portunus trituberculatus]